MCGHIGAHFAGIGDQCGGIVGLRQNITDDGLRGGPCLRRSVNHPRAAQRHMFPRPGIFALIPRKALQRHDQWPLRAGRSKARINLIQSAARCRDGQPRRHPLGEAVEIMHRSKGLRAIGSALMRTSEKIDQVEIRGMSQFCTAHPPECKDDEFAARNATMYCLKRSNCRISHGLNRGFGNPGITPRHR